MSEINSVNGVPSIPEPDSSDPGAGKPVTLEHLQMVLEAMQTRRKNFPDEPAAVTISLVFFNIGDRYAVVTCEADFHDWKVFKKDIMNLSEDVSLICPHGHDLVIGKGLRLGWIEAE